jgi:hypothetical protein
MINKIVWSVILGVNLIAMMFTIRSCQLQDEVQKQLDATSKFREYLQEPEEPSCPDSNGTVSL